MFNRLKSFLAPPVYEDDLTNRKAQLLNTILIAVAVLLTILWFARLFSGVGELTSANMIIIGCLDLLMVTLFFVMRRGRIELSVALLVIGSWVAISMLTWRADGVQDSSIQGYVIVILVASLLSGWRLALIITGLSIVAGWGFVYAESVGLIVPDFDPPYDLMIDYTFIFGMAGVMIYLLVDTMQKALDEARESNRSLQLLSHQLENRVQERTRDLALAAEVGQRISQALDLDKLLTESVELIRERFQLYHVQIYLTDVAGQHLNLRASTGSVGQQLLNRGHRLAIRSGSINGTAAFQRKPVLVPDTETSPIFQKNFLLPLTRSEMAVPLLMSEELLGVLDLQSIQPNAMSEESLPIYRSLAGQLAVAINNAYLVRQTDEARAEMERYVKLVVHEGWSEYLDDIEKKERIGVRYDLNTLEKSDGLIAAVSESNMLQVPITVANATIGVIQVEAADGQKWTEETQAVVTAVARQVGQQAESLRLLTETDRYRAEAEQAASRLSGEAWREFLREKRDQTTPGFVYIDNVVTPLTENSFPEDIENATVRQPLKIHNEAIGELIVAGVNSDEAHELLAGVSNQLSRHIENIRLVEQTESALGQTESLYQIGHELNVATNVDEILNAALGPIFPTGIDEATLMFIELDRQGEPQTLELLAGWRLDGKLSFPVGTIFPMQRFPFTSLFINDPNDPQLIGEAATDPRVDDFTRGVMAHAGIKAIAVIPLTMGGEWVGIITCSWPEPRTFSRQEEEIFNALINMAAPAVQSQRLYFKTKAQAEKEHLINEINQRIQNTVSVESALQTAVKELGQALNTTAQIKLAPSGVKNGNNPSNN